MSSQADPADRTHYIRPIAFRGTAEQAMTAVRGALAQVRGARVVEEATGYLHAEFRTRFMGFVDDVEFGFDAPGGVLHVRSASRLGRYDFGVNRRRIERLRPRVASGKAPRAGTK